MLSLMAYLREWQCSGHHRTVFYLPLSFYLRRYCLLMLSLKLKIQYYRAMEKYWLIIQ